MPYKKRKIGKKDILTFISHLILQSDSFFYKMFLRTPSWQAAFIKLLPRRSVCYSVLHISLTVTSPQLAGLKRLAYMEVQSLRTL